MSKSTVETNVDGETGLCKVCAEPWNKFIHSEANCAKALSGLPLTYDEFKKITEVQPLTAEEIKIKEEVRAIKLPNIDEPIDTNLVCQYCGSVEDEDTEVMEKHGGDESMSICEGCYDNMFA